jgi:hypothetical protein
MYYINGIEEVKKSIQRACGVTKPSNLIDTEFKCAYNKFLNSKSVFETPLSPDSILFTDFPGLKSIAPEFYARKKIFFAKNSEVLKERLSGNFFHQGLLRLKSQCLEIYNLVQFIVKVILINQLKSYTNGTTHETIGLSSIDFKDYFDEQDFIELVVHQMTHMILFIDDHYNPHMVENSKEVMIDTELQYKLGGNQFPAYLAFHSYIVGVEVLCFRQEATGFEYSGNYHGSTKRIIRVCNEFQKALAKEMNLFSTSGQLIFEKAAILFAKTSQEYQALDRERIS